MDRIEFTRFINSDNFESSLITYFDQIMSLYGILHEYDFKSIDNENVTFTIKFKSSEDAKKVFQNIPGILSMYDRTFYISKSVKRNNVRIEMNERE